MQPSESLRHSSILHLHLSRWSLEHGPGLRRGPALTPDCKYRAQLWSCWKVVTQGCSPCSQGTANSGLCTVSAAWQGGIRCWQFSQQPLCCCPAVSALSWGRSLLRCCRASCLSLDTSIPDAVQSTCKTVPTISWPLIFKPSAIFLWRHNSD